MKRWLRVALAALLALAALAGTGVAAGLGLAAWRMDRRMEVEAVAVVPATDARALSQGRYLFETPGCAGCHGEDGRGKRMIDGGNFRVWTPSIVRGPGSAIAGYRAEDWDRAIRHGLRPDGRALMFMPSQDFNRLTDDDLAALVGYVLALPDGPARERVIELPVVVRLVLGFGGIPSSADRIDHRLPAAQPVPVAVSVAHGRYVAQVCIGCHRSDFSGGKVPGGPPDWPAAADLRALPAGVMSRYADAAALARMFSSGIGADGRKLEVMPFESLRALSPVDVQALHLFLRSLQVSPH